MLALWSASHYYPPHAIVAEGETRDCAPIIFLSYVCKFAHPVVSLCCKAFVYIAIPCLMTRPCRYDSAGIFLSAFSAPPLVSTSPSLRPVPSTSCATCLRHRLSHRGCTRLAMPWKGDIPHRYWTTTRSYLCTPEIFMLGTAIVSYLISRFKRFKIAAFID